VLESRDFYGERAAFSLARRLDAQLTRELNRVTSPAEHVAVLRAFVTSLLLAMERADDSCGILADLARDHFPKYFTAPDVMFIGGGKSWRDGSSISDVVVCWFGTFVQIRTRFD
jgi:hypothetical protein